MRTHCITFLNADKTLMWMSREYPPKRIIQLSNIMEINRTSGSIGYALSTVHKHHLCPTIVCFGGKKTAAHNVIELSRPTIIGWYNRGMGALIYLTSISLIIGLV